MLSIFVFGVIGVCVCTGIGYMVYKNKNKAVETVVEKEAEVESIEISTKPGKPGDVAE
jgi:hypothetical protein